MNAPASSPRTVLPVDTVEEGLFLVGAERSGTTMLRLMLDHHPMVTWQNEFEFAVDRLGHDGRRPEAEAYREFLDSHRIFAATGYEVDPALEYAALVKGFLAQRRARAGKPIVGATVHRNFDRLLHIWPHARFIHLMRDPRDVAPSVIKMGWAGNCYHAAAGWEHAERAWDRVAQRVGPDRFIELHFEKLLADPRGELGRVCAFAGVPFDDAMLRFHETTTYEPPDPAAAMRWRKSLSPKCIGLIEGRLGALLAARGYEPSGMPPRVPGPAQARALSVQNRLARIRWRIKRYGWRLYISSRLAKWLSPRGHWPRLRDRIHEIDREHLR